MAKQKERENGRPRTKGWADPDAGGYFGISRGWAASLVMILPLLILYEIGVTLLHAVDAYAAAESWLKWPLARIEGREVIVFNLIVIIGVTAAIAYLVRRRELKPYIFPFMLIESAAYALLLLAAMEPLMDLSRAIFQSPAPPVAPALLALSGAKGGLLPALVIAAGAAVYEEILFRGILMAALFYLLYDALRAPVVVAGAVSILAVALLFSALHYMGDPAAFRPDRFGFRLAAGLVLSGIFLLRGLGVAVYTHAVFNVLAVLQASLETA